MSTYENDLRLEEIGTGERSGTWGTATNTNLELIANALSYSVTGEAIANASTHTITMQDGVADEARSFYLKCTGGGQACTVTLAPNTLSKVWMIENTTSYTLTFSQGSGANVAVLAGQVKMIATDGAGSGGAVFDLMQDLAVPDLFVDDDLTLQSDAAVLGFGADKDVTLTHVADTGLLLNAAMKVQFRDAAISVSSSADATLDLAADGDINLTAGVDINIPANVGLTFGDDGEKIEGDGTDLTIAGNNINLTAVADVNIPSGVGLTFATAEKIESDGTDLSITVGSGGDINIPADIGLTFGDDGEKIEGDGTDLTISGNNINLTAVADVVIPANVGITFGSGEKIEGNNTDITITSGADINLTATADINVPSGVGITFGDDGEKIEGDGTDLTITGNNINLTATADVVIPANVGITFGTGEKIEGDSTDLTITSGAKINLTATSDVVVPANVGITFGTGEKIEGDNTDLTITSGAKINLAATSDVHLANDIGMVFGDAGEKIEGNGTDLTINSSNDLHLTATTDINIPANVGLTFGDDGEKIEGDGTNLAINSSGDVNITATTVDLNGNLEVSGTITLGSGAVISEAELELLDDVTAGTAIASKVVTTDANIDTTGQRNLTITGELDAATGDFSGNVDIDGDLLVGDDLTLDSDAAVLGFGADTDVTLTHVADTGLLLNSTMAIQFNDASQFINAPSATVLDINATDEIELNATLVDVNANLDVSGTVTATGTSVFASLDISGDIDVDGTTNLDAVDIDGAVDMASTLQVDGVLTTTAATVFNGGFVSNANSTVNPTGGVITLGANGHITSKQSLDVATAGGRFIGQSNRGELGNIGIEQTANSTDGGYIRFSTAPSGSTTSAEHMRIQNNGSVGINVDNPNSFNSGAYNLVVGDPSVSSQGMTIAADENSTMYFADGTSGAEAYMGSIIYNHANNNMTFRTNGFNSALVIASDQSVSTPTAGTSNVRLGVNAGNAISSGTNYNVLIGDEAGTDLDGGDNNVAVGYAALYQEDGHGKNVAVGKNALYTLNAGADGLNVAVGFEAGVLINTGVKNTLIGGLAGDAMTTGFNNTVIGYDAMGANTASGAHVAIGYESLKVFNSTVNASHFNTAVGVQSGLSLATGIQNTMLGGLAGAYATTTDGSTFVGYKAAQGIDGTKLTGNLNTVVGFQAGLIMQGSCTENTILGAYAADNLTVGNANTFLGTYTATDGTVTGDNNTAVGHAAGASLTSGSNNLFLGHDAGKSGSPGGNIASGSNEMVLGDENITNAYIQVDWSVSSDQRDKTDFTALDLGLDFVKALAPVTYKWDKRSKYGDKNADDYDLDNLTPDGTHKEDWLDIGFKAQEVEALEKAAGYKISDKTNLVTSLSDDGKQYGMQYSKFVPILVKAIQEQNALIEALTARVATLEG
jgi:hypothetical protein